MREKIGGSGDRLGLGRDARDSAAFLGRESCKARLAARYEKAELVLGCSGRSAGATVLVAGDGLGGLLGFCRGVGVGVAIAIGREGENEKGPDGSGPFALTIFTL